MTKLITALCLAGCLALATPASAAVQTFGPDYSRFTIDVPDGWNVKPEEGGCQLVSPDEKTKLIVQVLKNEGISAAELAKALGRELLKKYPNGKILGTKDINPNQSLLEAEYNNVKIKTEIKTEGDKYRALTMIGPDEDALIKIADTIHDAK